MVQVVVQVVVQVKAEAVQIRVQIPVPAWTGRKGYHVNIFTPVQHIGRATQVKCDWTYRRQKQFLR